MCDVTEALNKFDSNHKVVKNDGKSYEIRTKMSDKPNYNDSCLTWIQQFSSITRTHWIVAKNYPNIKKLEFRKDYICQLSAKNKKRKLESITNRNKDCRAKIIVKIKKNNKFSRCKDPYLKENLNAMIVIDFSHNHGVNVAEAYGFLRASLETKKQFINYFESGMSPSEAKHLHRASLSVATPTEDVSQVLANAQINPNDQTIYDIYEKWRKNQIPPNPIEYAEVDVKAETITDTYCDQSFIAESPARCDDSLQEPSTSLAAIICPSGASVSSDCSAPKRKRNEIDISRMISSISSDIRSLIERSGTTNDAHFCHSVAFEIEKMDEDSKDLAKAAIWQVIYKVKSAKKKNVELNLEDMFK